MAYTALDTGCWPLEANSVFLPHTTCGHDAPRIRYRNELHVRFDDHQQLLPTNNATTIARPSSLTNGHTAINGFKTAHVGHDSLVRNATNGELPVANGFGKCADGKLDVNGNLKENHQRLLAPVTNAAKQPLLQTANCNEARSNGETHHRTSTSTNDTTVQPMRYRTVRQTQPTPAPAAPASHTRQTLESRFGALRNMQNHQSAPSTCSLSNGRTYCDSLPTQADRLPASNQRHPSANSAKSPSRADTLNSACSATLTQLAAAEWHFCGTRCLRSHQPSLPDYARPRHFHTPKLLRDTSYSIQTRSAYGHLPDSTDAYAAFDKMPRSATCSFAYTNQNTTRTRDTLVPNGCTRKPIVTRSPTSGALEVNDARFAYMIASQPHSIRTCNAIPLTLAPAETLLPEPLVDNNLCRHLSSVPGSSSNRVHIVDTPKIVTVLETADEDANAEDCTINTANTNTNNALTMVDNHAADTVSVRPVGVPSVVVDETSPSFENRENPFLPNGCLHREADQLIRQSVFKRDPDGKLHVLQSDQPALSNEKLADKTPPVAPDDANAPIDTSVSISVSVSCMHPIATPDRHASALCDHDKSKCSPLRTPHAQSNGNTHTTKAATPDGETHLTSSKSAGLQAAPAERRDPTQAQTKTQTQTQTQTSKAQQEKKKKKKRCSLM